ncbi:MAG: aminotransferase class V-fold PLP-dependent enzyme [Planctomycetaceae bacterium]
MSEKTPIADLSNFDFDELCGAFTIEPGVAYLNHGSFGPSPDVVRRMREQWSEQLEREPMQFFVRKLDTALDTALESLGEFVGCKPGNLAFVPNATVAVNVVIESFPLTAGDEVLFTDQEYGSVIRGWGRKCSRVGAQTRLVRLPSPPSSPAEIVDALVEAISPQTRLIVISHITSVTATIFPVAEVCRAAHARGVRVCVDGPHALAMIDLKLRDIPCDYYCASGHKWLSGPFGSGFLYVASNAKKGLEPAVLSWGKSLSGRPNRWQDEHHWFGTYDPAPYLTLPTAIDFLKSVGIERFRSQTHALVRFARQKLVDEVGAVPLTADDLQWYGSMVTLRLPQVATASLPPGVPHPLSLQLWEQYQIEVPIVQWRDAVHVRVSCHLYNTPRDIERLVIALRELIGNSPSGP